MAGNEIVARTESPAAASVSEDHYSERLRRKAEDSFKGEAPPRVSRTAVSFIAVPTVRILHSFHLPITDEGPATVWMAEARGTSPLHQLCRSGHGKTASFIAAVITRRSVAVRGAEK